MRRTVTSFLEGRESSNELAFLLKLESDPVGESGWERILADGRGARRFASSPSFLDECE